MYKYVTTNAQVIPHAQPKYLICYQRCMQTPIAVRMNISKVLSQSDSVRKLLCCIADGAVRKPYIIKIDKGRCDSLTQAMLSPL